MPRDDFRRLAASSKPDDVGQDVFVHISAVEKAGYTNLAEGARVSYELVDRSGKSFAEDLRVG